MELSNIENAENLSLILHWLQKQGSVAICKDNSLTLVKLFENGTKPPKISEVDRGICNLEKQVKVLEKNIEKLEEDKNAALCETRQYLAKKMKNLVSICIFNKKNNFKFYFIKQLYYFRHRMV